MREFTRDFVFEPPAEHLRLWIERVISDLGFQIVLNPDQTLSAERGDEGWTTFYGGQAGTNYALRFPFWYRIGPGGAFILRMECRSTPAMVFHTGGLSIEDLAFEQITRMIRLVAEALRVPCTLWDLPLGAPA